MNIQVGKSIGIALLLAAGLLAALFAMGVFSPNSVGADDGHEGATGHTHATLTDIIVTDAGDDDNFHRLDADGNVVHPSSPPQYVKVFNPATRAYRFVVIPHSPMLNVIPNPVVRDATDNQVGVAVVLNGDDSIADADDGNPGFQINLTKRVASMVEVMVIPETDAAATVEAITYTIRLDHDYAASSMTAGAKTRLTLKALLSGEEGDVITIKLPSFDVPSGIDAEDIKINNVAASDVTVDDTTIEVVIPDMDGPGEGNSNDDLDAEKVTNIRISSRAGITNPTKAGMYGILINDDADGTGDADVDALNVVKVIREIKLKPTSGAGDTTVTGTGFTNGSVTVFEGPAHSADMELGSATVTDGSFSLELIALERPSGDEIVINAIDSAGKMPEATATFSFKESITLSPEDISPGETLTIQAHNRAELRTSGDKYRVRFGGTGMPMNAEFKDTDEVTIVLPSAVRTGTLQVELLDGNTRIGSAVNVKIVALSLTITPSSVVPGQRVTVRGSGFVGNEDIKDAVMFGTMKVSPPGDARTSTDGSASVTVMVPKDVGTGDKTVKLTVMDREGQGKITVVEPSITLSPSESLIGSTVTVTGSGFVSSGRVLVDYGTVESLEIGNAASDGTLSMAFTVPSRVGTGQSEANIGRTSTVKVYAIGTDTVKAEAKHTTPEPMITVSEQAEVGGTITIKGQNWGGFTTVTKALVGGTNQIPSPAPLADRDGSFEFTARVPLGLSLGSHTASVEIKPDTATATFTVVAELATPEVVEPEVVVSTDPADVFASLGDRLVRVWYLDRATQVWSFYDPEIAALGLNMTEVKSGWNVSIIITEGEPIEFQSETLYAPGPGEGTNPIRLD